jgi:hypothetical protein
MRPEDVQKFLRSRPFRPFRLTLTDGRIYDVTHPELALVGRNWVEVGLARPGDPEGVADGAVTLSLLHIMQIENVELAQPPASW